MCGYRKPLRFPMFLCRLMADKSEDRAIASKITHLRVSRALGKMAAALTPTQGGKAQ